MLAAGASLVAMSVAGGRARAAEAQEQAVYQVDLDELVKAFPGQVRPASLPPLLARFGGWLAGKPWRSVGAFDLTVEWSDAGFPGGELFYDRFALFIRLPDGSPAGYWLAGRDPAEAPIVLLGSEGDSVRLAPNLDTLLARIALGDFKGKDPAADFRYSDADYGAGVVPDLRPAMQSFLRAETGIADLPALVRNGKPYPADIAE